MTEQTAEALRAGSTPPGWCARSGPTRTTRRSTWSRPRGSRKWDDGGRRLLAEARRGDADVIKVPIPRHPVGDRGGAAARDDPDGFAGEIARPMHGHRRRRRAGTTLPRLGGGTAGPAGPWINPNDLPGRADAGIDDVEDLTTLIEKFEQGPFGDRVHRVEAPFAWSWPVRSCAAGSTRSMPSPTAGSSSSTGKTGRSGVSDPLQLALYRLAWAGLQTCRSSPVGAAFYYVRTGLLGGPPALPARARNRVAVAGQA